MLNKDIEIYNNKELVISLNSELNAACRSKNGYDTVSRILKEKKFNPLIDNFTALVSAYHYERFDILLLLINDELIKSKLNEYKVGYRYGKDDPTIEQIKIVLAKNKIINF